MKYKCSICSSSFEGSNLTSCPKCGVPSSFLNEIDEIIEEDKTPSNAKVIKKDNPSVERIVEKCINCSLCKSICKDIVGIDDPVDCIYCGQCILNCPVGSLMPKFQYKKVLDYLKDTNKIVTISIAPAVRSSIGEAFSLEAGTFVEEKLVGALREASFDYVFDVTFGADVTIMEEASELIERLNNKLNLPMFTSCCPAWVKYLETYHRNLTKHLSTTKSPIAIMASLLNTYFLEMTNLKKEDVINVVVVPCTAKKYEMTRDELNYKMDYVITASELSLLLKELKIDLNNCKESNFDKMLGKGSGAGVIFGSSGGVMEAALRSANYLVTKEDNPSLLNLSELRDEKSFKEKTINIGDKSLRVLVVYGIKEIEPILKKLENKEEVPYDFIEVMNCPNGCVGGGGQILGNIAKSQETNKKRSNSLYQNDQELKVRYSYQNTEVKDLYQSYLLKPLSEKSEELLHTTYKK